MRITRIGLMFAAVAALMLMAVGSASATGGRTFTTTLLGANERPVLGDPDGMGTATLSVNPGQGRICYTLTVQGVDPTAAAHIHLAPAGSPGPVVVPLTAPTDGMASGCANVSRELALAIIKNPADYYVNVHNATYPGGALRGQLSR